MLYLVVRRPIFVPARERNNAKSGWEDAFRIDRLSVVKHAYHERVPDRSAKSEHDGESGTPRDVDP